MRSSIFSISCVFLLVISSSILAQDSPLNDRAWDVLENTDTIPDFRSKVNQLKLTGTIFESDGITPARDVVLFIEQPNEHGEFDLRRSGDERYVFHRSWVKTDADGKYTFYTFIPGNDRRYNQMQQIFPTLMAPSKVAVQMESLLFDTDPLLTKRCRKRLAKNGHASRILKTQALDGMLVAYKDIVLPF